MSSKFTSQPAVLVLVLAVGLGLPTAWAYVPGHFENNWDEDVHFECPDGQLLSTLYSYFSHYRADRRWRFGCRAADYSSASSSCRWSDYVNGYDEAAFYLCPANMALAGIASTHDNHYEDRRTKFKCCKHTGFKVEACQLTANINKLTYDLNYEVPEGKVIAGWVSEHFDAREDRYHRMIVCPYNQ